MNIVHAKPDYDENYIKLKMCDLCKKPMKVEGGLHLVTERGSRLSVSFGRHDVIEDYDSVCDECYMAFEKLMKPIEALEKKLMNSRHPFDQKKKAPEQKPNKLMALIGL